VCAASLIIRARGLLCSERKTYTSIIYQKSVVFSHVPRTALSATRTQRHDVHASSLTMCSCCVALAVSSVYSWR